MSSAKEMDTARGGVAVILLLTAASGEGLSKRSGALSIRALREAGFEPMAVASLAVLTGSSQTIEGRHDLATLADGFNLAR